MYQGKQCAAQGCPSTVKGAATRYCNSHRNRQVYWGSPTARRLTKSELEPYRERVRRWLQANLENPGIQAALKEMEALFEFSKNAAPFMSQAYRQAGYKHKKHYIAVAWEYLNHSVSKGLTALEAIELILAVWLLAVERPYFIEPYLTPVSPYLGKVLITSHGLPPRLVKSGKYRGERRPQQPRAKQTRVIGNEIWRVFSPLLTSFKRRIEQDAEQSKERRHSMRATFLTSDIQPTQDN